MNSKQFLATTFKCRNFYLIFEDLPSLKCGKKRPNLITKFDKKRLPLHRTHIYCGSAVDTLFPHRNPNLYYSQKLPISVRFLTDTPFHDFLKNEKVTLVSLFSSYSPKIRGSYFLAGAPK